MLMDFLIPFIRLINPRKLKGIKTLRGSGQVIQLYRLLRSGRVQTEEELRRELFGENPHAGIYWSNLKRELRERLVNTIICLPPDDRESQSLQAFQRCTKELTAVQQLLGKGARQVAVQLAQRAIREALKFQFAQQATALARLLYTHYATIDPDYRQKEHWREVAEQYDRIDRAEWELEGWYNEILYRRTLTKAGEPFGEREQAIDCTKDAMRRFPQAYRVHLLGYNILIVLFIYENDHRQVIETCRQAVAFFRALDYPTPITTIFSFTYKMIPSFIQLRQYEEAKATISESLELTKPGIVNWFAVQHYRIVLGFYSANFQLASEAVREVKAHRIPFPALREQMLIAEAYVAFFIRTGHMQDQLPSFRLGKFLNEVPTFSRDKRGMNINILILQTLFLLQTGQYDQLIDRMEALAMYTHRYLRQDEHFRSNCFINLLLLLPRNSFDPVAVRRKATPLLDKLKTAPMQADYDVEIVPYTRLWQEVMRLLDSGDA